MIRLIRSFRLAVSVAALLMLPTTPAIAQHLHDAGDTSQHEHQSPAMSELFPPRDASGTSWLPDETPMYGVHHSLAAWDLMLHGAVFGQFLYEPGDRHRTGGISSRQVSSVNWLMAMARRPAGAGRLGLRTMISVEPWTVRDCGFINLLANGELCQADSIHDRQHPHDLFMEVAADYDRPLRGSLRWQVYAGFAGEPALGPAAFPHRVSSMPNPIAPITHHWLDSSHITYGLITTGVSDQRWKAEVSLFNGREPDEQRADLDLGPLDSYSGRLTWMPVRRLAIQASAGHLNAAEAEFPPQPRTDVDRATASATYHRLTGTDIWSVTFAYGVNAGREVAPDGFVDLTTHAFLLESSLSRRDRHTWFGRAEIVGKPGHDLHIHEAPGQVFEVGKVQGGYERSFNTWKGIVPSIGGTVSLSIVPPELAPRYSGRVAPGFGVYFSVRPPHHVM